ncbi:MAG: hypothetical protein LUD02_10215 [Tannerellaceae bacterium]|nr:hypothetical protein [Tannerellaceae bacterium]
MLKKITLLAASLLIGLPGCKNSSHPSDTTDPNSKVEMIDTNEILSNKVLTAEE